MPDTQAFREKYRTGRRLCSLLPYVLSCGSLQPYWWYISAYISQVYTGSIPWGVPSCHAMILWRWDTISPHLLSSVSNCVSAVSLLTAPYTILRSQRNSFWCLLPTCLIELRIWWTIQSWTLVLGNTLCIVSGKRLSDRQCSISVYPWTPVLKIAQNLQPEVCTFTLGDIHTKKSLVAFPVDT